ncbi:MAG: MerR family transcriptional regulator [Pseudomonadota bacterium]
MADEKPKKERDGVPEQLMKMKDLAAAVGLPKSTILHYVNQGLLPEPVRTGPNMAYYHPACVERIGFIRQVQSKHRLPLAVIKGLIREMEKGRDVSALVELQAYLFGQSWSRRRLDQAAFGQAAGLSPEDLEKLLSQKIISPLENGLFDQEDVAIGRILKRGLERGVEPGDWSFYVRLAEEIVDQEMALRAKCTADLSFEDDAVLTMELTKAGRALRAYIIDRRFQRRIIKMKGLKNDRDK